MTQEHAETQLRVMQKFRTFWSSVSKLRIEASVPTDTQLAIKNGIERAYGKEEQGREHEG